MDVDGRVTSHAAMYEVLRGQMPQLFTDFCCCR